MRSIRVSDEIASRLRDVAKASEKSVEEVTEQFLDEMLQAWEPHLVKDSDGNVVDLFEEELRILREESGGELNTDEGEGWKSG